jgi:hypothetical protein
VSTTSINCTSYCDSFTVDGGEYINSASATDNAYATATASADYAGTSSYLPTLKASASSGSNTQAGAYAFGAQGYTYAGADTTITLDFNLHGSVSDNATGSADNFVDAYIAVIVGNSLNWDPYFGTLVYEDAPNLGYNVPGVQSLFITSGLDQNAPGSITFDVTNGMNFYVVASMNALSQNGYADASHTLTMNFNDDTGLTAASVSTVPVPAAAWLFGSGLIGLFGVARRKTVS